MTTSTDSRFDIEVLEPLLLMSASSTDCEALDFFEGTDAHDALDPFDDGRSADNGDVDHDERLVFVQDRDGESHARCRGNRGDYTVTDHGYGIYAVSNRDRVDFVTEVNEIRFRDGAFRICDITTAPPVPADIPIYDDGLIPPVETEFVPYEGDFDPGELLTEDVWFPVDDGEPESLIYEISNEDGDTDMVDDCPVVDPILNQGPDAVDDTNTTVQDVAVSGTVVTNDSDSDGDSLMFFVERGPEHGSIDMAQDGTYTYTPDPGFSGQDSFTYEANDGHGGTDIAEVCIEVVPSPCIDVDPIPYSNESPDAQDDANSTIQDVSVIGTVAMNDGDADGDRLMFFVERGPEHGTIDMAQDGTYTYTPDPGYVGQDSFTYEANDGYGGTDIAEVTVTIDPPVNEAPVAVKDYTTTDYETAVCGNVLTNDVDEDCDILTARLLNNPENGTVTLDADGTYTYVPDACFVGEDTFCYEVSDGNGGTSVTEVCILVTPQENQAPVAVDDDFTTDQNQAVEGNVLTNDFDPDGDALTASPLTDIQTFEGGIVTLHQDGSFVYMPADGFCGVDTFTYCMSDDNGGTATATVSITVNDLPAPPTDDSFEGDAGDDIKGNVILNDGTPIDQDSVKLVHGPEHGTLKLNADGTFCYTADDGFCGEDTFTYVITRACRATEAAVVRLVVADVQYDTTYESAGNGRVWGDPHFEGDDGGLYDVQGEASHVYNILSDKDLQVNAAYISWDLHPGSTMIGEIGATVGNDLVHADLVGTRVNGDWLQAGETRSIEGGTVEFDGEYTTVTTVEYQLRFHKRDGWMDMKLDALNPFSDNVAPHGLWGLTVDGDTEARNGDFFRTNGFDYTLQGGGALDTVDADGSVVVTEAGDRSAFRLYETADLFSTDALYGEGEVFFRFNAKQGTGLTRV